MFIIGVVFLVMYLGYNSRINYWHLKYNNCDQNTRNFRLMNTAFSKGLKREYNIATKCIYLFYNNSSIDKPSFCYRFMLDGKKFYPNNKEIVLLK